MHINTKTTHLAASFMSEANNLTKLLGTASSSSFNSKASSKRMWAGKTLHNIHVLKLKNVIKRKLYTQSNKYTNVHCLVCKQCKESFTFEFIVFYFLHVFEVCHRISLFPHKLIFIHSVNNQSEFQWCLCIIDRV